MHGIGDLGVISTKSGALVQRCPYIALEVDGGLQPDIVTFTTQPLEDLVEGIDLCAADGGHRHS